jgi:two-component system OmpR family sensor kinase
MSLRARLTLLYSMLLGGTLLVFGTLVYVLVNILLIYQVDWTLAQTVLEIAHETRVNQVGEPNLLMTPSLELTTNVYIQLWSRSGQLQVMSPGIGQLNQALDPDNFKTTHTVYRDLYISKVHLRVLSAPLEVGGRSVGVIQAATPLSVVDVIRRTLLTILVAVTVSSMVLAALASWLSIGPALAPLKTATATAEQIIRADDLSRRIPYTGPANDEIGTLIRAFNRTLGRLENLFTTQQRFLADVSHELRTPLTVIKGNADLIRKLKVADEESLTSIEEEADRLTRLVGDLLLLAKAESGKLQLNLTLVELDTVLLEVFHEMRVLAGDKISFKLTDIDQILVNGDRDRLKQVLINLVSNAIEYTPQGGKVFLSLARTGEQARLIVRDTGPGIPAGDLPHIFDRFYRGEKSRTRSKSTGFGLGLSIAHWIIDHHGGRVEVDSQDGKGTTFCIWLPIYKPVPEDGEK